MYTIHSLSKWHKWPYPRCKFRRFHWPQALAGQAVGYHRSLRRGHRKKRPKVARKETQLQLEPQKLEKFRNSKKIG